MPITISQFGKLPNGQTVNLFTIINSQGSSVQLSEYGALLTSLKLTTSNINQLDVVLGYSRLEDYLDNSPLFGAIVGRNINRISNAEFTIDNNIYHLSKNRGCHNIHSDKEHGFHKVLWSAEQIDGNTIKFSYISPDGEQGFPGELTVDITYSLTDANELVIKYQAVSTKKTLINISNHHYFNLTGHDSGNIFSTEIKINANQYTPVNSEIIPTGEILPVTDTPFDFRRWQQLTNVIEQQHEQLNMAGGFDHNFVLDQPNTGLRQIASARSHITKLQMNVYSDLLGLQFYTGNNIRPVAGKSGYVYNRYNAFCMEPQYFPNSINTPSFAAPLFNAGEPFNSTTIYQFTDIQEEIK